MAEGNDPRPPERPGGQRPGGPNLKMSRGIVSWLIFISLALMLLVMLSSTGMGPKQIPIDQFWTEVQNGRIEKIVLRDDSITGEFRPSQGADPKESLEFELLYPPNAQDDAFVQRLISESPETTIKREPKSMWVNLLISLLPWLLIFAFIWFVILRQVRNAGGGMGMLGSFGRSRHRVTNKEHTNVTFADVAGVEEATEEVQEVVEFLKAPKKFQRLGGRIPRGVLLVGEPGCGKTLLAKAIAGEADVPFFSISGSDFVEMFVGVGASRVRDLFRQAKENSPCIIFLDEIDAVGRKRGATFGGGGHDEREQTLNAILVEMDGFDTSDQVIVIAATNRADVLDQALVRPGRFDRQVYVPLPDVQGRHEILKVHARKIKLGPTVDLRRIARGTSTFNGADLAALINEAALLGTMADRDFVEQDDLEEARDKVRWGRARKSRTIDEKEQVATAYHEAGHALVQALEKHADPVHKVSILPRGPFGGATFSLPEKDRRNYSERFVTAQMRILCAGRISEQLFCDDVNTGAAADIRQATELARRMVTEWGMNEKLGFVSYADETGKTVWFDLPANKDYSERTARIIDEEIRKLIDTAYAQTEQIIQENKDRIEAIKGALLAYETVTGEEVNALIRGEALDKPSVTDLLDDAEKPKPAVGTARPVSAEPEKPGPDLSSGPLPMPG
ncbi:MAG: ATP-dependent zinc metalloprotease FtsH [Planctomycetota bacterium]|jgi:cell division protease FtsH